MILTFDDGYKDNFTTVYPLLRRYGIPATFFLSTAAIGAAPKWEDQLGYALFNSAARHIALPLDGRLRNFGLRDRADRTRSLKAPPLTHAPLLRRAGGHHRPHIRALPREWLSLRADHARVG